MMYQLWMLLFALLLFNGMVGAQDALRHWETVNDYIIQLQRPRAARLGATAYDLIMADISLAGSRRETIEALQDSEGGPKLVVAYMSIGQAANFQYYWQSAWRRDSDDAATYYESLGRETAYAEMADFVMAIAEHARERSPDFGIFTINGEDIPLRLPESGYMEAVTGILVEDLYYGYPKDHTASPADWTVAREVDLDRWVAADKLVLTVDYTLIPQQIDDAYTRSSARGYIPFVAERSLGRLLIHEGHEPD